MSPNKSVFNNENDPLYVQNVTSVSDATVISPQEAAAALDGNFYNISTGSLSVAANGFLTVQLTIPINSNRTIYIARVSGGAITNTTIDIFFNATFAAAGTALTPVNTNTSSSNTSVVTGKYLTGAADPTTGGTRLASIIQTGGPVLVDYDGRIIIPATTTTRTFYIRLANNTNQVNLLSINVGYWELVS